MAKKLNKRVAYTGLVILVLFTAFVGIYGFKYLRERNSDYCLTKAREAVKQGDYQSAEQYFGKAYGRNKNDETKIKILFEMAEFHLSAFEKHEPNWRKAISCWNTVLNINPQHVEAHQKMLDFYYQMADSGADAAWKQVEENSSKLMAVLEQLKQTPDASVMLTNTRACIEIARQGSVANREQLLDKAAKNIEQLVKLAPENAKVYEYFADLTTLKGEFDEVKGVQDARTSARKETISILRQGIEKASDKTLANVNLMQFRLGQIQSDPNLLPAFRDEMKKLTQQYPESERLFFLLALSYEMHAKTERKTELEFSAEYMKKALELAGGQNINYALRLASTWYRTGMFYRQNELVTQAIDLAEKTLTFPEASPLPGPKEQSQRNNRFMIQSFLGRCYLDQALVALDKKDAQAAGTFAVKSKSILNEVNQFVGESHLQSRLWSGFAALAEGKYDEAFSKLYKCYQEQKVLDKADQLSAIDPYLCYYLSRLAAKQNSLGLQREFLEKALYNRSSIAPEKPSALIDYAGVLIRLRSPQRAQDLLKTYISIYGEDSSIQMLLAQAAIQTDNYEQAQTILNSLDSGNADVMQGKLLLSAARINAIQAALNSNTPAPANVLKKNQDTLRQLEKNQVTLLADMLDKNPALVDTQIFSMICRRQISGGNIEAARKFVKQFLAANPDNIVIQLLEQELNEPDPASVTITRQNELLEGLYKSIQDPFKQALSLARYYRSLNKIKEAQEQFTIALEKSPNDTEANNDYFSFLLEQNKVKEAESLYSKLQSANADGYGGSLFAAQLEIAKENYAAALRRLDECIDMKPSSSIATILKSQIYSLQKKYPEAVEQANAAFQLDPQNGTFARQLASVLLERNRELGPKVTNEQLNEAERAVGIAMVLNPGNWQLQSIYAETISTRDPQRALAIRQVLLKNSPNIANAVMLGNMAMRFSQLETDKQKSEALLEIAGDAYRQGFQIDSQDPAIQSAYSEYLRQTNQRQQAVELFSQSPQTLWRFYLNDGQYPAASEIIEKLLKDTPNDVLLNQGLAEAYQGMANWEKLREQLDKTGALTLSIEQELWLIQKYLEGGFTQPAEKKLASFQERNPDEIRSLLLQAWMEMNKGNLSNAMTLTSRFLEKDSTNPSAWKLKGRIHRLLDQPQDAIAALQKSKAIQTNPAIRMELALLYYQTGQTDVAIGEISSGLNEAGATTQMRLMLESIYLNTKRTGELKQFYQKTIAQFSDSPFWYTRAGSFYLNQNDFAQAATYMEKAWTLSQTNGIGDPVALDNYLRTLIGAGKLESALTIASKYRDTQLAPVACWNIADIQVKQGQLDKAKESFSTAVEKTAGNIASTYSVLMEMVRVLGPEAAEKWCTGKLSEDAKFIPAHLTLTSIYEKTEAYNKALTHIDQCLANTPQNSPAWLELSSRKSNILLMAYSKTGDKTYFDQSFRQLEDILKLRPNDETIMNNLAYLMTDNDMQLDQAVDYARKAYQKAPDNPLFMDTYAYALGKTGQFSEAERYLRAVIQIYERNQSPIPWDVHKHLAIALEGQNKKKEAISEYRKALESPDNVLEKEKQNIEKSIEKLK